jgi:hypothetical protein
MAHEYAYLIFLCFHHTIDTYVVYKRYPPNPDSPFSEALKMRYPDLGGWKGTR